MKYLITGGAGFIGSNFTSYLLQKNHQVICLDNLSTGSENNISTFADNVNFTFVECDVRNSEVLRDYVSICDNVFHMAAAVGVKYILENPLETISTNVKGTESVLDLCYQLKKKVMIFSTSEVYGRNNELPFKESDNRVMGDTQRLRWAYASTKALDEFLAIAYYREKNLDVRIVRLFNTVGVGQVSEYGMVIPRFIEQALAGNSLTVYGDGSQSRCFCNVKDVTRALYRLMESDNTTGEIFNVGCEERVTILELAKLVIELSRSNSKIKFISFEKALGKLWKSFGNVEHFEKL